MAVNLERQRIRERGHSVCGDWKSASAFIKEIRRVEKHVQEAYGSTVEFEVTDHKYEEGQGLYYFFYRDETDKEMAERIANETRWEAIRTDQEAKEFARLKAKFEKKD